MKLWQSVLFETKKYKLQFALRNSSKKINNIRRKYKDRKKQQRMIKAINKGQQNIKKMMRRK